MKLAIAAAVASAAFSSPASAQTFDGPYVWLGAGVAHTEADIQERAPSTPEDPIPMRSVDDEALHYAVGAGFGWQVRQNYYLGIELEAAPGGARLTQQLNAAALMLEIEHQLGVSVRVGFLLQDRSLVYGSVGWYETSVDATTSVGRTQSEELEGVRVAVGYEHFLTPVWGVRAELGHIGTEEASVTIADAPTTDSATYEIQDTQLRLGAVLRF